MLALKTDNSEVHFFFTREHKTIKTYVLTNALITDNGLTSNNQI